MDGSNLATEGRTLPSLAQLDEAVRAYAEEDPESRITVVVDASFEHRIDESERETLREAMLNGEVVSPPAGAIGRGDAFVLRIAERTGAVVLSNDSFQEFHGQHPWLFDDGRLIGGKPVPGVGWIFTPRLPIRGAKSRAATAEKRAEERPGVGTRQGGGAGQGGQEGGQALDQEGCAGRRDDLADHAERASPGAGGERAARPGRSGPVERHQRGGRRGLDPATAAEGGQGTDEEEEGGRRQEGCGAEEGSCREDTGRQEVGGKKADEEGGTGEGASPR